MLSRLFVWILNLSPGFKKAMWKKIYEFLASKYQTKEWTFMNYGFESLKGDSLVLKNEEDERNRYFIQLYNHVVSKVDLNGLKALEIGSGRGGGTDFIKRYFNPNSITGVDYSDNAIDFCKKTFSTEGVSFQKGDAENLPFQDSSFDVVVNVESSHCYSNIDLFLSEVKRVLTPKGYFLFADFRDEEVIHELNKALVNSGLEIVTKENISKNVLSALDSFNQEKMNRFKQMFGSWLKKPLEEFAGMKGSTMYNALEDGSTVYYHYIIRKKD